MRTVNESIVEPIQPHQDNGKTPSFSALIKERFFLDIYKAAQGYGAYLGMDFLTADVGRITVTSFEIASAKLDFESCFAKRK